MAQITIGGKEYIIPEMNFLAIERAWPYIEEATGRADPIRAVSAAISVFAAALMEAEDFDKTEYGLTEVGDLQIHQGVSRFLKKKLKGTELEKVTTTLIEVMKEAGLEVTEGEALAAYRAALGLEDLPSQETAPVTLPSLLPPESKEDPGTP